MTDTAAIRKKNTFRIRRELTDMAEHTAHSMSAATGLSIATCNGILRQMAQEGEALSEARQTNEVGRKTWFYRLSPGFARVLYMGVLRRDHEYRICCSIRYRFGDEVFSTFFTTHEDPVTAIPQYIREILSAYPDLAHVFIACLIPAEEKRLMAELAGLTVPCSVSAIGSLVARMDFDTTGVGIASFVIANDSQRLYIFHSLLGHITGDRVMNEDALKEALPGFFRLFQPGHFVIIGNGKLYEELRAGMPDMCFVLWPDGEALLMKCMDKWMRDVYTGVTG